MDILFTIASTRLLEEGAADCANAAMGAAQRTKVSKVRMRVFMESSLVNVLNNVTAKAIRQIAERLRALHFAVRHPLPSDITAFRGQGEICRCLSPVATSYTPHWPLRLSRPPPR